MSAECETERGLVLHRFDARVEGCDFEIAERFSIAWIQQHSSYTAGPLVKLVDGMRKAGLQ